MSAVVSPSRRPFRVLVSALIAVAGLLVGPGAGAAEPAGPGSAGAAAVTVDPAVTRAIDVHGSADLWVRFPERADLAAATATGDWAERGAAVVAALRQRADDSQRDLRAALESAGADVESFWAVNAVLVRDADAAVLDLVAGAGQAASVELNGAYRLPQPADGDQVAPVEGVEWGVADIKAPAVWQEHTRGEGVVVANIDSGVDGTHPALAGSYRGHRPGGEPVHDHNWFDPTGRCGAPAGGPCDDNGHGTHTMGTMAGDAPQAHIGVAPGASWIAVKGCTDVDCPFDTLAAAGQWILAPTDLAGQHPDPAQRPHVVNSSWGLPAGGADEWYRELVRAWVAAGIFPSFSAGNNGGECGWLDSPGSYPESYATGAYYLVDGEPVLAPFSARGPSPLTDDVKPDVTAPGVDVRSAFPEGLYASMNGTSMAAPHVAGTVALILSAAPALVGDVDAVRGLLDAAAVDTPEPRPQNWWEPQPCGGDEHDNHSWGQGRLDAFASVRAAPRGAVGSVAGTVTGPDGAPLAGVTVTLSGATGWTATTGDDGAFALAYVPAGDYAVTTHAFGYHPAALNVAVAAGAATAVPIDLRAAPRHAVAGSVDGATPAERSAAAVTVLDTPLDPVPVAADGSFRLDGVPEGTYTVSVEAGGCLEPATTRLVVDGDETLTVPLLRRGDDYGHRCELVEPAWLEASQAVDAGRYTEVDLPFPVRIYGSTYPTAWMTSSGYVTFSGPHETDADVMLPDPAEPNAAVYPFWGYLIAADPHYYVGTVGEAPNRTFVMEWRGVWPDWDLEVDIQVQFAENGDITFLYRGLDPAVPLELGAGHTVGIENATGTDALVYSHDEPVLSDATAIRFSLPPSGAVEGTVTDANDGAPVAAAEVTLTGGDGDVVRRTVTGDDGRYQLQAPLGDYVVGASAGGYRGRETPVAFDADREVHVTDLALDTGRTDVHPDEVELVTASDTVTTRALELVNTGTAPLTWSAEESPSSLAHAPGDVLDRWAPGGTANADAIAVAGDAVWVYDEAARTVSEYRRDGTPAGRSHPTPWVGAGGGDLAYDSTHGLLCQLAADGAITATNWIACWDPGTGELRRIVGGAYEWAGRTGHDGLAYDPATDTFLVSAYDNAYDNHLIRVAGLSHPVPGSVAEVGCRFSVDNVGDRRHVGLAWDAASGVAWFATRSDRDTVYGLDTETCQVVAELAHPDPGYHAGGLDLDAGGDLWAVDVAADEVFRQASGQVATGDVPWLSLSDDGGPLAPGAGSVIVARIDTTGLAPGVYDATVRLAGDGIARTPVRLVPVRAVVTAYDLGVDIGGRGLDADGAGRSWASDERYTAERGWGRESGRAQPVRSAAPIGGATDDQLYQRALLGELSYRFDDLPPGAYEVELLLAETQDAAPGERVVDVLAGQTLLHEGVDVAATAGQHTALVLRADVEVSDGVPLRLRFFAQPGSAPPLIGAIRLTHRPDR